MRNPVSRFAYSRADLGLKRSQFGRSQRHLTTMSAGLLYPLLVDEVLPGDTYTVDLASLLRMSTPIHPVMDNCYLDTYWFFVPNRLSWDKWKAFMGEQDPDNYADPIEYRVPVLKGPMSFPEDFTLGIPPKSVLDYMGIPSNSLPEEINAIPVRDFALIWNYWFRDQNLQNPIDVPLGDEDYPYPLRSTYSYSDDAVEGDYWQSGLNSTARGGYLPPVNKYHDYFTSALPLPQKGQPVPIPLSGFAPVYGNDFVNLSSFDGINNGRVDVRAFGVDPQVPRNGYIGINSDGEVANDGSGDFTDGGGSTVYFNNLGADLSNLVGAYATINDLRYAFQVQKFLEADNRGGTRYHEILKQHFNVISPDATQQIPEFLGGKRIPINIAQVLQTSATNEVSPQGNTAAYSLTTDKYSAFTKSFTEHGYLFCVGCIRTEHTYQQGIEKFWNKVNKFDYYFPEFANIGEQPIYNRELYNVSTSLAFDPGVDPYTQAKEIFGYQEAWADYRYKPNRVSGEFRSTYSASLDIWHYGDVYLMQPYLSSDWIKETRVNIDRTLAVSSNLVDQFICDFYFNMKTTRVMPVYSIPGLADHH